MLAGEKEIVIAAPPGAGKTKMLIEFIRNRPGSSFLIVCHGTQFIKDQWKSEFKEHGITATDYDDGVKTEAKIIYELPQTLEKRRLKAFDFVVYDEAHQYSQAAMGARIRELVTPKAPGGPDGSIRPREHQHLQWQELVRYRDHATRTPVTPRPQQTD